VLLLLFFGSNKVLSTLETHSTKATEVGESNKAGVWWRSPQPPEANGISVVDSSTVFYFCYFLEEIKYVQLTLETHSTKATEVGESNKAEVSAPDDAAIFQLFSQKHALLGIFWSKFLLKTEFLNG